VKLNMIGNKIGIRYGEDNPEWKGESVGYAPLHQKGIELK